LPSSVRTERDAQTWEGRSGHRLRSRDDVKLALPREETEGLTDDREELIGRYRAAFGKLEFPPAAAAKRTIGKIASLAAFGQERFNAATTGRSDPVAGMTAARMAAE
jgi:hypothetical protein